MQNKVTYQFLKTLLPVASRPFYLNLVRKQNNCRIKRSHRQIIMTLFIQGNFTILGVVIVYQGLLHPSLTNLSFSFPLA